MNIIGLNNYPSGIYKQTDKLIQILSHLNLNYCKCEFKNMSYNTNIISMNPFHLSFFENYITGMNNIGLWTWETCNFPDRYVKYAKHFRQIWCLSKWNKEILEEKISSQYDTEINVIKLPFECEKTINQYNYDKLDETKMLFIYDKNSGNRKNVFTLINTINELKFNCSLTLKSLNENRIINTNKINMINKIYTEDEMKDLYMKHTLYTSLHSSEGFGFTIIDAMRFNIPVVCTGFSGNMDYCNNDNSFLINYDMFHSNETYFEGEMAKPNVKHFIQTLNFINQNKNTAIEKSNLAFNEIKNNYNIDICSKLLEKYIP